MNMARADIVAGALLCAFGVTVFFAAPLTVGEYNEVGLTPSSFPSALSAIIAVLSAVLCWNGWRNRGRESVDEEKDEKSSTPHIIAAIVVMGRGLPTSAARRRISATSRMTAAQVAIR